MGCLCCGQAFSALIRRNLIYRKRKWLSSILEFILPIAFIGILVGIKASLENTDGFEPETVPSYFPKNSDALVPFSFGDYVTALQAERKCVSSGSDYAITGLPNQGVNWQVPFVKCDSRKCNNNGEDATGYCEFQVLAVAPEKSGNARAKEMTKSFVDYVTKRHPQVANSTLMPFKYSFFKTFDSDEAMEDYVTNEDYGTENNPKIGMGVVFSESSTTSKYNYVIRVNSTNFNAPENEGRPVSLTTPPTDTLFDSFAKTNDDAGCVPQGGTPPLGRYERICTGQYMYNGAITIQRLLGDWILSDAGAPTTVAENGVQFVPFPSAEYVENGFYAQIAPFAPLLVVLGLLYPVAAMIRLIVSEKELRQKELMKMMSVTEATINWSWFVSLFMFNFLCALATAGTTNALYSNSSFVLLLIFWILTFMACIVFSMSIAACFSKTTKATLVGLLLFFIGYFLTLAVDYQKSSTGLIGLVSLHPVAAFSFGLQVIGQLEDAGVGITGDTYSQTDNPSGYGFNNSVGALVIDCILWGILSWYLNRVVPGTYGQPLTWYFPCSGSYWCGDNDQEVIYSPEDDDASKGGLVPIEPVSDALKEQKKEGRCVEIQKLTKEYGTKIAVSELSLSMYSGQVTALLGHNGAGKTTTINMLTGMVSPTSGSAIVAGRDINTQMNKVRKEVGICLQHDCLFPLLTVKEHIQFFARIKGMYDRKTKEEVENAVTTAISDVALLEKRNTLSKNLSGGMKRKLSVAIAFCGESKTVILDEPTSGMDPFSRRFTWNVIRQYRQDRCIILTTHFMDEADLLGDRIAIMSEGQLRCAGSPLFLKKKFGVGYQLTIEKKPRSKEASTPDIPEETALNAGTIDGEEIVVSLDPPTQIDEKLKRIVMDAVPGAKLLSNVGTECSFQLPIGASDKFIDMFEQLDKEVESKRIVTYGVSVTTLDEVFLKVARGDVHEVGEKKQEYASLRKVSEVLENPDISHRSKMDLDKEHMFKRHVQALFAKRALNFKRDKKAWCCSTILPSVFVLAGFLIVAFAQPSRNQGSLTLMLNDNNPDISKNKNPIPFNDAGDYSCQPGTCIYQTTSFNITSTGESYNYCGVAAAFGKQGNCASDYCGPICGITDSNDIVDQVKGATPEATNVSEISESSRSVATTAKSYAASQYGALYFTHDSKSIVSSDDTKPLYDDEAFDACLDQRGEYMEESQCQHFKGIGYVVSYNFTSLHSSVLYQAVADEAILRQAKNDDTYSISATIHPLPITSVEDSYGQAEDSFSAWFLLVLSFPFITGAFATFVVSERMSKAKHLQTVAGVKPSAYWISSYMWDILNYQLPLWITVILMYATGIDSFTTTERGAAGGIIVTLMLFGPAAAGFTYCLTFAFKSPSMCQLFVIVFNFLIGMAGPLVCLILRLIGTDVSNPNDTLVNIASIIEWILRFIPSFNLGKALFFTINAQVFEINAGEELSVWSPDILLYEVIFLAWQTFAYILLAIQIDKWSTKPKAVMMWRKFVSCLTCRCLCTRKQSQKDAFFDPNATVPDDEDVITESERVRAGEANDDLIVLNEITKRYDTGKLAVNHMSLGIPPGECFGLLGINGAGKTTTMGMLTAEFPPTSGDATLAGFSVRNEPEQTRRRIGYCPQFDAHFMNMTGREHVELYASIKGVPKAIVKEAASYKLSEVGLNEFDSDKLSSSYSGGMKRKLSVACATIGQPQIVFLDEPSTGMDPVARRDLWQVISDMVAGDGNDEIEDRTSVILTTHSMEECEALCPRIGIMAGGRLRCLGSAQHLKTRFGRGYQVEMKVKEVSDNDEDYKSTLQKILGSMDGATHSRDSFKDDTQDVEANNTSSGDQLVNLEMALDAAQAVSDNEYLSSMITADSPTGYVVYKNASSPVGVPARELAAFCVDELRIKSVLDFFETTYENSILRERQDNKVRFEVGSDGLKISSLFAVIEENKADLQLADYGVSQTSLEQVFNMHAAEAEKAKHVDMDRHPFIEDEREAVP